VKATRAVVLGADLECLAAAATLARAGLEVSVVDAADEVGAAARRVAVAPGHSVPGLWNELGLVRRSLLASLDLEGVGAAWSEDPPSLHVLGEGGQALEIGREACGSAPDREAYLRWRQLLDKLASLVRGLVDEPPPDVEAPSPSELLGLAMKGLRLRGLGQEDMMELLRVATLPAWDWLEERFQDPALRAGLCAPVLSGGVVGPRGAGTTALLILRETLGGVEPAGGLAALADALRARCESSGVRFRLGDRAQRLIVDSSSRARVSALELVSGEQVETGLVLSTLDPDRTLGELLDPGLLPRHVAHEARHWRQRGSSAVHLLALQGEAPLPGNARRLITAGSPLELERAADALKYGELPEQPWLDVRRWSGEPHAPAGAASWCVHVHGVPRQLDGDWTAEARSTLRERVLTRIEECVLPEVRQQLVGDELLTPADLEARFGLPGGHLYGGELALDQLWAQRPCLALGRYRTPVAGLYLGGASSHPGGPFACGAGVLAARAALADR